MPFMSLKDNTHPHLVFVDENRVLPWSYGHMLAMVLQSRFVRITSRGVQFSFNSDLNIINRGAWNLLPCKHSAAALCEEPDSQMQVFPTGVVDVPGNFALLQQNSLLQKFDNNLCHSPHSGRLLKVNDTRYELSLCDLVDSHLDIIYDRSSDQLWWHEDTTSVAEMVLIFATAVYLMSCVSVNIVRLSQHKPYVANSGELLIVFAVLLYTIISRAALGLRLFVSTEDEILLWTLVIFACLEWGITVRSFFQRTAREKQTKVHPDTQYSVAALDDPQDVARWVQSGSIVDPADSSLARNNAVQGISMPLSCLLLLTARVHYSFENPYTAVLTVLFGVRSWTKFLSFNEPNAIKAQHFSVVCQRLLVHVVDMASFCLLLHNVGRSAHDSFEVLQEQASVALIAVLGGTILRKQQKQFA